MASGVVFNPGDRPVSYDDEGREVGGGEWVFVPDLDDPNVQSKIQSGALQIAERPESPEETNPAARDKFDQIDKSSQSKKVVDDDAVSGEDVADSSPKTASKGKKSASSPEGKE